MAGSTAVRLLPWMLPAVTGLVPGTLVGGTLPVVGTGLEALELPEEVLTELLASCKEESHTSRE